MGGVQIRPRLVDFLNRHRNMQVTVTEIQSELGISAAQARAAMRNLIEATDLNIEVLVKAQMWRLSDGPKREEGSNLLLLEVLGKSKDGRLIAKDDDDNVYKVEEL